MGHQSPWMEYEGDRGGRGWKHRQTGEIRYQEERPDAGSSESAPEQPSRPSPDQVRANREAFLERARERKRKHDVWAGKIREEVAPIEKDVEENGIRPRQKWIPAPQVENFFNQPPEYLSIGRAEIDGMSAEDFEDQEEWFAYVEESGVLGTIVELFGDDSADFANGLAQACCLAEGGKLHLSAGSDENDPCLFIEVSGELPGGGSYKGDRMIGFMNRGGERLLVCTNQNLEIRDGYPGAGRDLFVKQVQALRELGVDEIHAYAAGSLDSPTYNGYYTWPRMGYQQQLNDDLISDLPPSVQEHVRNHDYQVSALMEIQGGPELWMVHGKEMEEMVFDLHDDSRSMKTLMAYVQEKNETGTKKRASTTVKGAVSDARATPGKARQNARSATKADSRVAGKAGLQRRSRRRGLSSARLKDPQGVFDAVVRSYGSAPEKVRRDILDAVSHGTPQQRAAKAEQVLQKHQPLLESSLAQADLLSRLEALRHVSDLQEQSPRSVVDTPRGIRLSTDSRSCKTGCACQSCHVRDARDVRRSLSLLRLSGQWVRDTSTNPRTGKPYAKTRHVWQEENGAINTEKVKYVTNPSRGGNRKKAKQESAPAPAPAPSQGKEAKPARDKSKVARRLERIAQAARKVDDETAQMAAKHAREQKKEEQARVMEFAWDTVKKVHRLMKKDGMNVLLESFDPRAKGSLVGGGGRAERKLRRWMVQEHYARVAVHLAAGKDIEEAHRLASEEAPRDGKNIHLDQDAKYYLEIEERIARDLLPQDRRRLMRDLMRSADSEENLAEHGEIREKLSWIGLIGRLAAGAIAGLALAPLSPFAAIAGAVLGGNALTMIPGFGTHVKTTTMKKHVRGADFTPEISRLRLRDAHKDPDYDQKVQSLADKIWRIRQYTEKHRLASNLDAVNNSVRLLRKLKKPVLLDLVEAMEQLEEKEKQKDETPHQTQRRQRRTRKTDYSRESAWLLRKTLEDRAKGGIPLTSMNKRKTVFRKKKTNWFSPQSWRPANSLSLLRLGAFRPEDWQDSELKRGPRKGTKVMRSKTTGRTMSKGEYARKLKKHESRAKGDSPQRKSRKLSERERIAQLRREALGIADDPGTEEDDVSSFVHGAPSSEEERESRIAEYQKRVERQGAIWPDAEEPPEKPAPKKPKKPAKKPAKPKRKPVAKKKVSRAKAGVEGAGDNLLTSFEAVRDNLGESSSFDEIRSYVDGLKKNRLADLNGLLQKTGMATARTKKEALARIQGHLEGTLTSIDQVSRISTPEQDVIALVTQGQQTFPEAYLNDASEFLDHHNGDEFLAAMEALSWQDVALLDEQEMKGNVHFNELFRTLYKTALDEASGNGMPPDLMKGSIEHLKLRTDSIAKQLDAAGEKKLADYYRKTMPRAIRAFQAWAESRSGQR